MDGGNTVLLIEHHLDMIKNADWIIDMGPGAGDEGGAVVTTGTPEAVAGHETSETAVFLREALAKHGAAPKANGRHPSRNGHTNGATAARPKTKARA